MKFPPSNREQKANKGSVAVAPPPVPAGFPSDDEEPREQREKHFSGDMEARRAEQIHS